MWYRLKQWALSTMGSTSAQIFGAWKQFVQFYGGVQQLVGAFLSSLCSARLCWASETKTQKSGADVPAEVGLYVMPNPGCAKQIAEDAGGMAGRITRIIRGDGSVESEHEMAEVTNDTANRQEEGTEGSSGDGSVTLFVEWASDGLEKGDVSFPKLFAAIPVPASRARTFLTFGYTR
jgi:hypothetical protein